MSLTLKILAAKRLMESHGIVCSRIVMGNQFHDKLLSESEEVRGWHGAGEPRMKAERILTVFGMDVTVDTDAPPGDAWISTRIG